MSRLTLAIREVKVKAACDRSIVMELLQSQTLAITVVRYLQSLRLDTVRLMKAIVVLVVAVLVRVLRPAPPPDNRDFRIVATYSSQ